MEIKPINEKRKIVIFKSDVLLDKKTYKEWADRILNNSDSIIFLPPWISYEVVEEVDDLRFLASDSSQISYENSEN